MILKVLKRHPHAGQFRDVGSVYECPDKKARLMIVLGKAEEYKEPPKKRGPGRPRKTEAKAETAATPATYATKVIKAED